MFNLVANCFYAVVILNFISSTGETVPVSKVTSEVSPEIRSEVNMAAQRVVDEIGRLMATQQLDYNLKQKLENLRSRVLKLKRLPSVGTVGEY